MKTVITKKPQAPTYPYLAVHKYDVESDDPMIVLFTERDKGILVSKNVDQFKPMYITAEFEEVQFTSYNGEITLSN